jgi:type IV pilus assembly protein PilP
VELAQYSIDELKLVAIVLGGDQPRAMFVDPSGKGTVVYKGSFVCRPEVVHIGGSNGPEYQLNWRVDRIRDGDVVLLREDPAQPAIPAATRVVPLHPEADKEAEGLIPG